MRPIGICPEGYKVQTSPTLQAVNHQISTRPRVVQTHIRKKKVKAADIWPDPIDEFVPRYFIRLRRGIGVPGLGSESPEVTGWGP